VTASGRPAPRRSRPDRAAPVRRRLRPAERRPEPESPDRRCARAAAAGPSQPPPDRARSPPVRTAPRRRDRPAPARRGGIPTAMLWPLIAARSRHRRRRRLFIPRQRTAGPFGTGTALVRTAFCSRYPLPAGRDLARVRQGGRGRPAGAQPGPLRPQWRRAGTAARWRQSTARWLGQALCERRDRRGRRRDSSCCGSFHGGPLFSDLRNTATGGADAAMTQEVVRPQSGRGGWLLLPTHFAASRAEGRRLSRNRGGTGHPHYRGSYRAAA
jgi:hypothetical protein